MLPEAPDTGKGFYTIQVWWLTDPLMLIYFKLLQNAPSTIKTAKKGGAP